ncbi:MAG TPA: hypothetical protein VFO70_04765 [Chitinophagaceae bacterium]|nr:hypothetical protein [Chitinophagaceae bacterium]
MSANKPIKRSPELIPLSREHHDGLLFTWKIKRGLKNGTSMDKLRKYSLWFWKEHIKPHFFQEEMILLPLIPTNNPMAVQLKNEHAQIRELVLGLDKEADREIFVILCDLLERHIRWEEREFFVFLEQSLAEEQLAEVHRKLEEHPVSCGVWEDEFWN